MPCCEKAKWKREEIADHKFDYIDVDDFIEDSLYRKVAYAGVFLLTLKSIVVYMNDLLIASLIFQTLSERKNCDPSGGFSLSACGTQSNLKKFLPQEVRPYLIISSVIISFILLFIDWRKAQIIIKSRDISYSFTSTIAYRYYVLRSYAHYCLFCQIQNSRRTIDILAFFVFFQFKGWKRLLFAEFPRQLIIAVNLVDLLIKFKEEKGEGSNFIGVIPRFLNIQDTDTVQKLLLYLSVLSIFIFAVSFLSLITAFFTYIPLLCVIRGNLKEYCCHKIDKRIGELLRKKSRKRTEEARRAELAEIERNQIMRRRGGGGETYGSDGGSEVGESRNVAAPLGLTQRPTLPDIDVDLDAPMMKNGGGTYAQSEFGGSTMYAPSSVGGNPRNPYGGGYGGPPPMPGGFSDNSSDYGGQVYRNRPPPASNRLPPMMGNPPMPGMMGPGMLPPGGYRGPPPNGPGGWAANPYNGAPPASMGMMNPPPPRSTSPSFSDYASSQGGAVPPHMRNVYPPPHPSSRSESPPPVRQGGPPNAGQRSAGASPSMRIYAPSETGSDHASAEPLTGQGGPGPRGYEWRGDQGQGYRGGQGGARPPPQAGRGERF
ncbi:hypothetical protein HDU67_004956 [Dinochytrium kinnereticum]|nr:hypothetical protein HDU67_004956 [Dinochytrium kinnereticum]